MSERRPPTADELVTWDCPRCHSSGIWAFLPEACPYCGTAVLPRGDTPVGVQPTGSEEPPFIPPEDVKRA
jgi:endogenous inhibitor of DNA gyrase (YacG/DUF329 family)